MELIKKSDLNISNSLSFFRILLAIPIIYCISILRNDIVLYLALAAVISDWLDGYFARKYNQITELGKILDPIADKITIGGAVIALSLYQDFPLWLTLIIVARDVVILVGALFIYEKHKQITSSNWPGKITVTFIAVAVITFLMGFKVYFDYLIIFTMVTITLSAIIYSRVFFKRYRSNGS